MENTKIGEFVSMGIFIGAKIGNHESILIVNRYLNEQTHNKYNINRGGGCGLTYSRMRSTDCWEPVMSGLHLCTSCEQRY